MLSSLKSASKQLLLRLPIIGNGLRFANQMVHLPRACDDILGRVTVIQERVQMLPIELQDQVQALPNMWAPVSEQVWEAQAAACQVMADDLRVAFARARKEHADILESMDCRLAALEQQLDAAAQSTKHAA